MSSAARFIRFFEAPLGKKRTQLRKAWQLFDIFVNAPCESTLQPGCECCLLSDHCSGKDAEEYYSGIHLCWYSNDNWLRDDNAWTEDGLNRSSLAGQAKWKKWLKDQQIDLTGYPLSPLTGRPMIFNEATNKEPSPEPIHALHDQVIDLTEKKD